jgi:hypothetical protein
VIEGRIGTLAVRSKGDSAWHDAGDIIEVLAAGRRAQGFGHLIAIVSRADLVVNFADGSAISEISVRQMLTRLPELAALQIPIFSPDEGGEIVRVVCVPKGSVTSIDFERVRAGRSVLLLAAAHEKTCWRRAVSAPERQ